MVALDAVVRLVECAGEIHARIGELEALAIAPAVLCKADPRETAPLDGFHGDQMMLIQLVGHFEENVAVMFADSGGRERGPGGVAGGGLDAGRVFGLVLQPL